MNKLSFELGYNKGDSFGTIFSFTTHPKPIATVGKTMEGLLNLIDMGLVRDSGLDVRFTYNDVKIPTFMLISKMTFETLDSIFESLEKEGETNGNTWNTITVTGRTISWLF